MGASACKVRFHQCALHGCSPVVQGADVNACRAAVLLLLRLRVRPGRVQQLPLLLQGGLGAHRIR